MAEICLFGTTRIVTDDDDEITELGGVKGRQLLEVLALHHGQPVSKDHLAEAIWDGRPPTTWTATLESHVSVVRRRLAGAGLAGVIATVSHGYTLSRDVPVDLSVLRSRMAGHQGDGDGHVDCLAWLPRDELLASSPHASFAVTHRQRLTHEVVAHCRRLARQARAAGRLGTAVELARVAETADPFSDTTQQLLIEVLAAAGDPAAAMHAFADFRDRMHDELGVEPGAGTYRAYLAVLSDHDHGTSGWQYERGLLQRLLTQTTLTAAAVS